jgi:hypothetical protein
MLRLVVEKLRQSTFSPPSASRVGCMRHSKRLTLQRYRVSIVSQYVLVRWSFTAMISCARTTLCLARACSHHSIRPFLRSRLSHALEEFRNVGIPSDWCDGYKLVCPAVRYHSNLTQFFLSATIYGFLQSRVRCSRRSFACNQLQGTRSLTPSRQSRVRHESVDLSTPEPIRIRGK